MRSSLLGVFKAAIDAYATAEEVAGGAEGGGGGGEEGWSEGGGGGAEYPPAEYPFPASQQGSSPPGGVASPGNTSSARSPLTLPSPSPAAAASAHPAASTSATAAAPTLTRMQQLGLATLTPAHRASWALSFPAQIALNASQVRSAAVALRGHAG